MGVGVHWREHVNFTIIQTLTLTIGMFAIIFQKRIQGCHKVNSMLMSHVYVHTGMSLSYLITRCHVFLFLVTFHFFFFFFAHVTSFFRSVLTSVCSAGRSSSSDKVCTDGLPMLRRFHIAILHL